MTTEMTEEQAPPALFFHCVNTYKAMLAESHAVVTPSDDGSSDEYEHGNVIVYEGFLTQLIQGKLNLSVPYYTSVTQALIRMGCIRQLRRGGGTSPSQWEMIYEPTEEAFFRAKPPKTPKQTKEEAVSQQITTLTRRISDLEDWQSATNEFLAKRFGAEEVQDDDEV